ncbi:MAG: protein kinase [Nitrospirae bacterium]|nr:protein kinase [Nitrospirota bacterium]
MKSIDSFNLPPGFIIAGKYRIISKLGEGWEGEAYKIAEIQTGIERTAKLFYPKRNPRRKTSMRYAKKLHKLRHCPMLIKYHTGERFTYKKASITALISEYVEGEVLSEFLKKLPGKRLHPFEAVHLLHILAKGIEQIHQYNEYHGDLHLDNIMIKRFGLSFEVKILDFYHWEATKSENKQNDIIDLVRVLYDSLGGAKHYAKQPDFIKYICCGLKRSLIIEKFRTVSILRKHLELMEW